MAVFAALGLGVSYELLRGEEERVVAVVFCLLLGLSPILFEFATQMVFPRLTILLYEYAGPRCWRCDWILRKSERADRLVVAVRSLDSRLVSNPLLGHRAAFVNQTLFNVSFWEWEKIPRL